MPVLKAKISLTAEFKGRNPGSTLAAAKEAGKVLADLINVKFQDRKGQVFLVVKDVSEVKVLTSLTLLGKKKRGT
jgi:hypothetical protein